MHTIFPSRLLEQSSVDFQGLVEGDGYPLRIAASNFKRTRRGIIGELSDRPVKTKVGHPADAECVGGIPKPKQTNLWDFSMVGQVFLHSVIDVQWFVLQGTGCGIIIGKSSLLQFNVMDFYRIRHRIGRLIYLNVFLLFILGVRTLHAKYLILVFNSWMRKQWTSYSGGRKIHSFHFC